MNEFYAEWSQMFIFVVFFASSFSSGVLRIELEVSWIS